MTDKHVIRCLSLKPHSLSLQTRFGGMSDSFLISFLVSWCDRSCPKSQNIELNLHIRTSAPNPVQSRHLFSQIYFLECIVVLKSSIDAWVKYILTFRNAPLVVNIIYFPIWKGLFLPHSCFPFRDAMCFLLIHLSWLDIMGKIYVLFLT